MKEEYPGLDHPKSLSIREDQLLPPIDEWLCQLFNEENLDDTIQSLAATDLEPFDRSDELLIRQSIKECNKRIANFETALGSTDDPATITGFIKRIEQARSERQNAELRLRNLITHRGLSPDQIRQAVSGLADAVGLLSTADPTDRRKVYEATQLEVLYDHQRQQARLSIAPGVTGGVGGGT